MSLLATFVSCHCSNYLIVVGATPMIASCGFAAVPP